MSAFRVLAVNAARLAAGVAGGLAGDGAGVDDHFFGRPGRHNLMTGRQQLAAIVSISL
jgi:hypothetical protein